jgi:plasmid maintenance system antidote protein VapI
MTFEFHTSYRPGKDPEPRLCRVAWKDGGEIVRTLIPLYRAGKGVQRVHVSATYEAADGEVIEEQDRLFCRVHLVYEQHQILLMSGLREESPDARLADFFRGDLGFVRARLRKAYDSDSWGQQSDDSWAMQQEEKGIWKRLLLQWGDLQLLAEQRQREYEAEVKASGVTVGQALREYLTRDGKPLDKELAATKMGITVRRLENLLDERPHTVGRPRAAGGAPSAIDEKIAVRLGEWLGTGAAYWMALQAAADSCKRDQVEQALRYEADRNSPEAEYFRIAVHQIPHPHEIAPGLIFGLDEQRSDTEGVRYFYSFFLERQLSPDGKESLRLWHGPRFRYARTGTDHRSGAYQIESVTDIEIDPYEQDAIREAASRLWFHYVWDGERKLYWNRRKKNLRNWQPPPIVGT